MGILNNLFGKNQNAGEGEVSAQTPVKEQITELLPEPIPVEPTGGILNLKKNQILDLTKATQKLSVLRVAAGWDIIARGADYDLDVAAYLYNSLGVLSETVYYGKKNYWGVSLDGDNRTGEGEGDDETITVDLEHIDPYIEKIVFAVVIYKANTNRQSFAGVKNAYTRVLDDSQNGKELCRFDLSENGGDNTAVIAAELLKNNGNWSFRTIGNYSKDTIETLKHKI